MIPQALCRGHDLPLCQHCARLLDRYSLQVQARNPGRISPSPRGERCDAWRHAPAVEPIEATA